MFESMHKFSLYHFVVRVWREEESQERFYPRGDLADAASQAADIADPTMVSRCFGKCERVTAVEVLDHHGNGGVAYTVWP